LKSLHDRYTTGAYLLHNPAWDIKDSPWKAEKVVDILRALEWSPKSICEVGCGAGGVLAELRHTFPEAELFGYDIAPDAAKFWNQHTWAEIHFEIGDFFVLNRRQFDSLLVLDVVEHLQDPFNFLGRLRSYAETFVFHIPIDLSALNVMREKPLMLVRTKVGHIHYFTKRLALALLEDCGYDVLKWCYTGAAFTSPQRTGKSKLASLPRRLAYSMSKDWGVRLLGGETLMVLARAR
jgi:SAM-dependent methyltransferase